MSDSTDKTTNEAAVIQPIPKYIENILHQISIYHKLNIFKIEQKPGTSIGDGYMSNMLAIRMHGQSSDGETPHFTDVICKRPPGNATTQNQFETAWIYEREVLMYDKVLPMFAKMQRDMGLDSDGGFYSWPRCFYASFVPGKESESVIVMEDLRSIGYKMWEKTKLAPAENITLLLEQLARMHALSFVLRDQQPNELEKLEHQLSEIYVPILQSSGFEPLFASCFKRLADLMHSTKYGKLVDGIKEHWLDLYRAAFDRRRLGRFAVVTHGDCWSNNMMFKFENVCLY